MGDEESFASSTVAPPSKGEWAKYVSTFLPLERSTEFSPEELEFEKVLVKNIGDGVWNSLPMDLRLNILRGNAHEKERLKVTSGSAIKIANWRAKYGFGAALLRELPNSDKFFSAWPTRIAGLDDFGHPIVYDIFSACDLKKIVTIDEEAMFLYRTQFIEILRYVKCEISQKLSHRVGKHIYILDVAGLDTLKHFSFEIKRKLKPFRFGRTKNSYFGSNNRIKHWSNKVPNYTKAHRSID